MLVRQRFTEDKRDASADSPARVPFTGQGVNDSLTLRATVAQEPEPCLESVRQVPEPSRFAPIAAVHPRLRSLALTLAPTRALAVTLVDFIDEPCSTRTKIVSRPLAFER